MNSVADSQTGRPLRRLLMVAYHFPPLAGSSGIQRTLRFVQQLPRFGWAPIVLTTTTNAYERVNEDLMADVPPGIIVHRALALDAARHLSVGGRHFGAMARPDRWVSWRFDGVRQGMAIIRKFRPSALWSTFPIATAHVVGAELQRRSGLPWIADFRDPMAQNDYPTDPATWQSYKRIEERTMALARHCLFTTPTAAKTYRERYPAAASRIGVLENGFDEDSFASVPATRQALNPGCVTLVHSGIVYPSERDPRALFAALRVLQTSSPGTLERLRIRFRAPVHEGLLTELSAQSGLSQIVQVCPPLRYREALAEMLDADGLLVLQAANCNAQVPAKVYEYLRARRPILALTDPAGDTASVVRHAGIEAIAPLDDAGAIADLLKRWVPAVSEGTAPQATEDSIAAADRLSRTSELARLLDGCVA